MSLGLRGEVVLGERSVRGWCSEDGFVVLEVKEEVVEEDILTVACG